MIKGGDAKIGLGFKEVIEAPFVNIEFLTQSPETLVVFETADGEILELGFSDYSAFKRANPDVEIVDEHTHSYSAGGIHPQCAVRQADETRQRKLKDARKQNESGTTKR